MVDEGSSLEQLFVGGGAEKVAESDEVFSERARAAQARLKKAQRNEARDNKFDQSLAKIITDLDEELLNVVIFLIDHEVPSLTVLSLLSLEIQSAMEIVWEPLKDDLVLWEPAPEPEVPAKTEHIERWRHWLALILSADQSSFTVHFADKAEDQDFSKALYTILQRLNHRYWSAVVPQADFPASPAWLAEIVSHLQTAHQPEALDAGEKPD